MDDKSPERAKRPPSLTAAIRAARLEEAERTQAVVDLRGAEGARLDVLREAIEPVLAQIPVEVDLFDIGIVPGEHPRLFIDMISFVEMARDRRTYRFLQDTRHGRVLLAENDGVYSMTEAVTRYIARRLVEREQILASLGPDGITPRPLLEPEKAAAAPQPPSPPVVTAPVEPAVSTRLARIVRIGVDGLGVLMLGGLVWLGVQYVHGRFPNW